MAKILHATCGLLNVLMLTQMFILMIRIAVVDITGVFQKYVFLLRVIVDIVSNNSHCTWVE